MMQALVKTALLSSLALFSFGINASISRAESATSEYISLHQRTVEPIGFKTRNVPPTNSATNNAYLYANVKGGLNKFKFFIPPGTTNVSLFGYVETGSIVLYSARYGQPPQPISNVSEYTKNDYEKLEKLPKDSYRFAEVAQKDCLGRQDVGYLLILEDNGDKSVPRGDWLYVDLYILKGAVMTINSTSLVDVNAYTAWYNSYTGWLPDGDPGELALTPTLLPTPSHSLLSGDLNQDKKVDIYDYSLFLAEFGKVAAGNLADIDKNGKVDIFDYNIFLGNFGKTG